MEENLRGCVGGNRLYRGWVSRDERMIGGIDYWAFVVAPINVVYVFCKYIKSIIGFDMRTRPPAGFHQLWCRSASHRHFCIPKIELPISVFFLIPLVKSLVLAI